MSTLPSAGREQGTRVRLLARERYAEWDALVDRSPHGCIFHHSWWLEAGGWPFGILVAEDEQGRLVAGIPLPRKRVAGLTLLYTPPLTPFIGPVFDLALASGPIGQLGLMRTVGEELARGVADYDGLSYWIGPTGPDLQGFLWAGFRVEVAYTFRFDPGTSIDAVLAGADAANRGHVRRAERGGVAVEQSEDIERFLVLNRLTFQRQGIACPWSDDLVRRIWAAARGRGCARLYLGRAASGEDAAGAVVVHDRSTSYQLLVGGDPVLRATGAGNLVLATAIGEALGEGRAYDFEGSLLRGVERHFRQWGASPRPIWRLERAGTFLGALARLWRRRRRYQQVL